MTTFEQIVATLQSYGTRLNALENKCDAFQGNLTLLIGFALSDPDSRTKFVEFCEEKLQNESVDKRVREAAKVLLELVHAHGRDKPSPLQPSLSDDTHSPDFPNVLLFPKPHSTKPKADDE